MIKQDVRTAGVVAGEASVETRAVAGEGGPLELTVVCRGDVPPGVRDYAVERLTPLAAHLAEPVLFARVKLTVEPDPARERPCIAEVAVDVNGELVRAHIAAHEMREAVDLLQRRLRDKLEHRAQHRAALRKRSGVAEPGAWRHGDLGTARPDWFDRPVEDRKVMRQKSFPVGELTVDEAVFDMEQADYDFFLFTELGTGQDACIERQPDGTYLLTRLEPGGPVLDTAIGPVGLAAVAAPELTEAEAIERLEAAGGRHLFFVDVATGRGSLLYRRYDGHYGLLTPKEPGR